jgi:hypothetical protein
LRRRGARLPEALQLGSFASRFPCLEIRILFFLTRRLACLSAAADSMQKIKAFPLNSKNLGKFVIVTKVTVTIITEK